MTAVATSTYLFLKKLPLVPLTLLVILSVAVIVYAVSRPVKGLSIIVPALIPAVSSHTDGEHYMK